jgi:hypothetical protein
VFTYLSKIFYFLGDLIPVNALTYAIYRRLMLISVALDRKCIVWKNNKDAINDLKVKMKPR